MNTCDNCGNIPCSRSEPIPSTGCIAWVPQKDHCAGEEGKLPERMTVGEFAKTDECLRIQMASMGVATSPIERALATQVGGGHYKDMPIQPVEFIHKNGIGFAEGCVIKYVSRWRKKNGVEDLKKARHFLDLLIEMEEGKA